MLHSIRNGKVKRRFSTRRYIFHDTMFRSLFYLKDWKWRKVRISEGALSGQLFHPAKGGGSLWIVGIQSPTVSTYYSAYLFLLNWLLPLLEEGRQFSHSYHFENLLTIILVLGANMYAELDMSLDMFKWQPFEENCTRSRRRKTRFYELSRHKRVEKFCKELKFNSRHFPTSLSLSLAKRNKKKQGIPKHFYASTCTLENLVFHVPKTSHFVPTLSKRWLLNSNFFPVPLLLLTVFDPANNRVAPKIYTFVQ